MLSSGTGGGDGQPSERRRSSGQQQGQQRPQGRLPGKEVIYSGKEHRATTDLFHQARSLSAHLLAAASVSSVK